MSESRTMRLALSVLAVSLCVLLGGAALLAESYRSKLVDAHFSPGGGIQEALIAEIRGAKKSIEVGIYTFTNSDLADALIQRAMNGVEVRVIFDEDESKQRFSKFKDIVKDDSKVQALKLQPEGEEADETGERPRFHHKFCVIDGVTVITGSFNWTRAAESRNCEDLIILRHKQVASAYRARFEELWKLAR